MHQPKELFYIHMLLNVSSYQVLSKLGVTQGLGLAFSVPHLGLYILLDALIAISFA